MATIQGVYVALFGRPADPTGLAYFNSVTKNGADLSAIGDLASTQEYKDRFAGQSNTQIVTAIYQSLFNRAPESAGLTFFVDALNKGTLNIKNIAISILDGAQGDDKTIATNKITAADNFTKAIDTPVEIGSYQGNAAAQAGRNFISGVTKDAATIPTSAQADTALAALAASTPGSTGTVGVTINLSAANEVVGPNNANAAFKSTAGDDTINIGSAGGATVINNNTTIDASAGTDSLVIKGLGTTGTAATNGGGAAAAAADQGGKPTLTSVEKISVTFTGGTGGAGNANAGDVGGKGGNFTLDVSGSTGVKEVWNDTSLIGTAGANGANGAGGAGGDTVTFDKITLGTALGIKGDTTVNTVFNFSGATGSTDSATLTLKGADATVAAKTATINGIETLNVAVDGSSKIVVVDSTLDKVVVTGSGDLNFATASTTVKTVDASALNGALTLNVNQSASGVTFTGTKVVDKVTLNAAAGANDVLVYNTANKSTVGLVDEYTNTAWKPGGTLQDKIDVKAFNLGASTNVTVFTAPASGAAADGTSFGGNKVAVSTAADVGAAKYVYFDLDGNNKFDAASDLVIKVDSVADFTKDNVIWA